jgi:hypothetical protein
VGNEVEPSNVLVDVACGRYYAATVTCPVGVTCGEAKASLNTRYAEHELASTRTLGEDGLWRVLEEDARRLRFAIQIGYAEDTNACRVIYISGLPLPIMRISTMNVLRELGQGPIDRVFALATNHLARWMGATAGSVEADLETELKAAWDAHCGDLDDEGQRDRRVNEREH